MFQHTKHFSSLATAIGVSLLAAACTTSVPAPVIDRSAERAPPRTLPPSQPLPPLSQPSQTPQPSSGVVTAPAPGTVITERSAPPAGTPSSPIISGAQPGNTPGSAFHVVQRGETLYRIAVNNGLNVDALASWNGLVAGQTIREGQVIRLRPPEGSITSVTPIVGQPAQAGTNDSRSAPPATSGTPITASPAPLVITPEPPRVTEPRAQRVPYSDAAVTQMQRGETTVRPPTQPATAASAPANPNTGITTSDPLTSAAANANTPSLAGEPEIKPGNGVDRDGVVWTWPTTGRIASKFNERAPMKGIDIAAKAGTPVVAAAPGKVIYVGKEPRGFGQMIVVSHAKETVSVYFHTDKVLVKEQQRVTLGQRLAEVSDGSANKMHFEVRKQGRPTDPVSLMPAR
ncbi:MAG: peptidoglycan DD-metalloendopeptidase family protein [Casimicrobium sp.]